ncbi:unnamed protein product [Closterium sp. NIES-64]|nr:unnamed protein product [Closterium sp. NIES-64]
MLASSHSHFVPSFLIFLPFSSPPSPISRLSSLLIPPLSSLLIPSLASLSIPPFSLLPFPHLSSSLPSPPVSSLPSPISSLLSAPLSEDACKAAQRNPCAVGQCVNDGAGSYSCVPPGFRQGTTVDSTYSCAPGTFSCAPIKGFVEREWEIINVVRSYHFTRGYLRSLQVYGGDTNTTYTVLSPNVRCSDVFLVYGLTLTQFQTQNPSVSCAAPIPPSTVLNVASPASLIPCSVFYTTQQVFTSHPPCQC